MTTRWQTFRKLSRESRHDRETGCAVSPEAWAIEASTTIRLEPGFKLARLFFHCVQIGFLRGQVDLVEVLRPVAIGPFRIE
jgi:hypothetical protein